MSRTFLRLRDGGTPEFVFPANGTAADHELKKCLAGTPSDDDPIIQFATPQGPRLSVHAQEIVGAELEPPYRLLPDFLKPQELDRALAHALAHGHEFVSSTVADMGADEKSELADTRFRRSRILQNAGAIIPFVAEKLMAVLPTLWPRLGLTPVPIQRVEYQMTAHGDGDFFDTHTDNGLPVIAHRLISYVYYFHAEPKRFSGGLLRLYRSVIENGANTPGRVAAEIDPPRNGLIVFPSYIHHQVTQVDCASAALSDQRLTINGWLVP